MRVDEWLPMLDRQSRERATDLRPFHLENVGLEPSDAIRAVHTLAGHCIATLGGEIWILGPSRPEHTKEYRGWHVNQEHSETWLDFTDRAAAYATESIERLRLRELGCFVVLTLSRGMI